LRIFELKLDLNRRKAAAACPTEVKGDGKGGRRVVIGGAPHVSRVWPGQHAAENPLMWLCHISRLAKLRYWFSLK
jgi:hypothetical protein